MCISVAARKGLVAAAVLSLFILPSAPRAHAVSKEIVELQTQVQQLLDRCSGCNRHWTRSMGVLQHLAEQTADDRQPDDGDRECAAAEAEHARTTRPAASWMPFPDRCSR